MKKGALFAVLTVVAASIAYAPRAAGGPVGHARNAGHRAAIVR